MQMLSFSDLLTSPRWKGGRMLNPLWLHKETLISSQLSFADISNSGFGRLKPNTDVAESYANQNQHPDKDTQSTSELFANYAKLCLL